MTGQFDAKTNAAIAAAAEALRPETAPDKRDSAITHAIHARLGSSDLPSYVKPNSIFLRTESDGHPQLGHQKVTKEIKHDRDMAMLTIEGAARGIAQDPDYLKIEAHAVFMQNNIGKGKDAKGNDALYASALQTLTSKNSMIRSLAKQYGVADADIGLVQDALKQTEHLATDPQKAKGKSREMEDPDYGRIPGLFQILKAPPTRPARPSNER